MWVGGGDSAARLGAGGVEAQGVGPVPPTNVDVSPFTPSGFFPIAPARDSRRRQRICGSADRCDSVLSEPSQMCQYWSLLRPKIGYVVVAVD